MRRMRWLNAMVIGLLLVGCGTTEPEDPGDPPVLPLLESLVFDTETFPSSSGAAAPRAPARQSPGGTHHTAAAWRVLAINVGVALHLAVPVGTWGALVSERPTFENGQWHWTASRDVLGVPYTGDLTAYEDAGDVVAEVRISSPAVQDFLWYRGRARSGGATGQWEIFDANVPSTPTVVATIDWSHPSSDVWTLTFTAVGGPNPGDQLTYEVDGTHREISWYDASEDVTAVIEWNALTRDGSIMVPGYNNGAQACWDGTLQNVACP